MKFNKDNVKGLIKILEGDIEQFRRGMDRDIAFIKRQVDNMEDENGKS